MCVIILSVRLSFRLQPSINQYSITHRCCQLIWRTASATVAMPFLTSDSTTLLSRRRTSLLLLAPPPWPKPPPLGRAARPVLVRMARLLAVRPVAAQHSPRQAPCWESLGCFQRQMLCCRCAVLGCTLACERAWFFAVHVNAHRNTSTLAHNTHTHTHTHTCIYQAAEQAVHNLVAQLNSLPSFSVPAIDAVPAAPQLLYMPTDDPHVSACLATVATGVHDNACGPQAVLQALEQHERLVRVDANRHCRLFNESMHPPVEIEAEVSVCWDVFMHVTKNTRTHTHTHAHTQTHTHRLRASRHQRQRYWKCGQIRLPCE